MDKSDYRPLVRTGADKACKAAVELRVLPAQAVEDSGADGAAGAVANVLNAGHRSHSLRKAPPAPKAVWAAAQLAGQVVHRAIVC